MSNKVEAASTPVLEEALNADRREGLDPFQHPVKPRSGRITVERN